MDWPFFRLRCRIGSARRSSLQVVRVFCPVALLPFGELTRSSAGPTAKLQNHAAFKSSVLICRVSNPGLCFLATPLEDVPGCCISRSGRKNLRSMIRMCRRGLRVWWPSSGCLQYLLLPKGPQNRWFPLVSLQGNPSNSTIKNTHSDVRDACKPGMFVLGLNGASLSSVSGTLRFEHIG